MAQAGIHGLVSMAVRRWTPERTWLMLGIVLGSLLPDADNLAVAVATLTKSPTEGLHRTFTHSLITIAAVMTFFFTWSACSPGSLTGTTWGLDWEWAYSCTSCST